MVRGNTLVIATTVALAKDPNVSVKVCASPGLSRQPYPFRDVAEHQAGIGGPRPAAQLLGTDITNSYAKASYRQRITHLLEELSFLSEANKDWMMGRNLAAAEVDVASKVSFVVACIAQHPARSQQIGQKPRGPHGLAGAIGAHLTQTLAQFGGNDLRRPLPQ
jgi:hypothetical protein